MATSIPLVVKCGDPVVLQVSSNNSGKTGNRMPRVICEVTCGNRKETLSCTVPNEKNAIARFNLSDTLTGFVNNHEQFVIGTDGIPIKLSGYTIEYSYEVFDVFYNDAGEQTEKIGGVERLFVKAGSSSDYRLNRHGEELSFLSLKQKSFGVEHVLRGFPYLISRSLDGMSLEKFTDIDDICEELNLCVIDYNPMMHHPIIFRNSFGELESCLAWCRQKIDVKVQHEVYVTSRAAYDGQRTQLVSAYDDEMQIALTTGGVTPMWAQWWTFEPLRSRRAWIWMPTDLTTAAGTWVPCILKQDNNTILDRSKGASEINFTAVLDWQGGLL